MSSQFKVKPIYVAIGLALATQSHFLLAVGPYPALPPTLSTSVTPNILLHIDNSGSMNNPPNSKTTVKKITTAKTVAKNLIDKNKNLRWGLFSFDPNSNTTSGVLQAPINNILDPVTKSPTGHQTTLNSAIDGLNPDTWTPLGEAMVEITRYFGGQSSYYGKTKNLGAESKYTSPIQYRCQKNFAIIITDGFSTKDNELPGKGKNTIKYKSYTYNSSNLPVAVDRDFNICTAATSSPASNSIITCPDKLEGSSTSNPFVGSPDDSTTYGRSIRDTAMYARDADFRVVGVDNADKDLDGKSFDDPKFIKQNLSTYTVGFAINDPVLNATAIVGGGSYETAATENELTDSLTNAVNSIVASISNAGGVATQTDIVSSANKVFQPVFNPQGWYGELRCFDLDSSGNFNPATSQCTPNAKAVIPAVANRKIYSSKVTGTTPTTTSFVFNDSTGLSTMTTAQSTALGSTDAIRKNTINFIRGTEGISGFRTRPNGLLGDIVDSQPVVVSKPVGQTLDTDYSTFTSNNANRNMVFIGANDGMLHAFNISNMTELMAYIPSPVYSNLKSLTASDYGISGGTAHEFHVNGSMRQADVKLAGAWKTIVVGGLGQGGKGYFAVDATQDANFSTASDTIKWEWTDQSTNTMGYAFGTPIIYNVRTATDTVTPAVILTNGYENKWVNGATNQLANTSSLYIINANTGALIKQIDVTGGIGLSSPAGVDAGQDGVLDYVYAGDINGKLWRFDLTDDNPANFKVISTPIYNAGTTKPIVMRPAVMQLNKQDGTPIGNLVMFGTGKLLTDTDRTDVNQQSFYSIIDKMEDSPTTVVDADLQLQTIIDTKQISSGTDIRVGNYRKISSSPLDLRIETNTAYPSKNKGWYINFPTTSERIVTSPMIFEDKILFGTGIPQSTEKCIPGGKGWIMGLNPFTGSVTTNNSKKSKLPYSFIDIKKDGKSTDADKVAFSSGTEFISGFEKDGIPTELTYVASENKIIMPTDNSGSSLDIGKVIAQREANYMAVYTGNPKLITDADGKKKSAIKIYKPMPKPASTGKGTLYGGTIGNDTVDKETLLTKSSGVKVETSTWREIK